MESFSLSALKYAQSHPRESHWCFQMAFCFPSFLSSGPVSGVAQKDPVLVLMHCCCHLNNFWKRCPHFHFELCSANYVLGPAFLMKCLGQTFQMWAFTSQFRPLSPSREVCFFHCFHEIVLSNVITNAINGSFFLAVKLCTSNTGFQSFFEMISSLSCHDTWLLLLLDLMFFLFFGFFFGLTLPAFPLGPAPHLEVPSKTEQSMVELFLCKLVYSHTSCHTFCVVCTWKWISIRLVVFTVSNLTTNWTWYTRIFPTSFFFFLFSPVYFITLQISGPFFSTQPTVTAYLRSICFMPPWEIFCLSHPCSLGFHLDQILEADVSTKFAVTLLVSFPDLCKSSFWHWSWTSLTLSFESQSHHIHPAPVHVFANT